MLREPKVSIGIPVFNGEEYLRKRLDSILGQTFTDYEIIISDNASSDMTNKICKEYLNKDKRIRYVRQNTNIGFPNNFNFLINEAKGEYYIAAAADDLWEPTFLEKNVKVLDTNKNVVGSISKVEYFGYIEQPKINPFVSSLKKIVRRQNAEPINDHVLSVSGDYEKKVSSYLRFNQGSFVYGLFRTEKICRRRLELKIIGSDLVFILNILKEGDLFVIDEILMRKFVGGLSSKGFLDIYKRGEITFVDVVFPFSTLAYWCLKNIGFGFFLKNMDWFSVLLLYGWRTVLIELLKYVRMKK